MEPEGSLPHLQELSTCPYPELFQEIRPSPRLLFMFHNRFIIYGEGLLASCPTPQLEDHLFTSVRGCLFNIFPATLHSWRPFLDPQPEDAPCCGDRDPPRRAAENFSQHNPGRNFEFCAQRNLNISVVCSTPR
jgi:hypothetical protein